MTDLAERRGMREMFDNIHGLAGGGSKEREEHVDPPPPAEVVEAAIRRGVSPKVVDLEIHDKRRGLRSVDFPLVEREQRSTENVLTFCSAQMTYLEADFLIFRLRQPDIATKAKMGVERSLGKERYKVWMIFEGSDALEDFRVRFLAAKDLERYHHRVLRRAEDLNLQL